MGDNANAGALTVICLIVSSLLFTTAPSTDNLNTLTTLTDPSPLPTEHYLPPLGQPIQLIPQPNQTRDETEKQNLTATINKALFCYINYQLSGAEVTSIASRFNLVVLNEPLHPANNLLNAQALKAANPAIKILVYRESHMLYSGYSDYADVSANHEDYFLHTSGAARIQESVYGWWLMDAGNVDWRSHLSTVLNAVVAEAAYDGVFLDDVHDEVPNWWSLTGAMQAADITSWHNDVKGLLDYLYSNITPGKLLYINSDQRSEYDYAAYCDGVCTEYFLTLMHSADVEQIDDAVYIMGTAGKNFIALSYTDGAVTDALVEYCYNGYLLCADASKSYFAFNNYGHTDGYNGQHSIMDVDVGTPSGAYAAWGGTQRRLYTKGAAILNPSVSNLSIAVGTNYVDASDNSAVAPTGYVLSAYNGLTVLSPYTITSSATTGGSVSPSGATEKAYGSTQVYTPTATDGYFFNYWTLDGNVYGAAANPLTYSGAEAGSSHTLIAYFTLYTPTNPQVYYVEAYAGQGGSVSPSGQSVVEYPAGHIDLTATANYGYTFTRWKLNNAAYSTDSAITYSAGVPAAVYIFTAEFTVDYTPPTTYTVTASAGANGSITNSGVNVVNVGTPYASLATADGGYIFSQWLRNGVAYSTVNPISISLSQGQAITLEAVFIVDTETPPIIEPDPPAPEPLPTPEALTAFNRAVEDMEKKGSFESVWEPGTWEPGTWDECKLFRAVTRQMEKSQ